MVSNKSIKVTNKRVLYPVKVFSKRYFVHHIVVKDVAL